MHFLEIFGQKKGFLGQKQYCLGKKLHEHMVCIAFYTELNVQICNCAQKQRICCKNSKHALDEPFYGHFCPRQNAANFCHPLQCQSRLDIVKAYPGQHVGTIFWVGKGHWESPKSQRDKKGHM